MKRCSCRYCVTTPPASPPPKIDAFFLALDAAAIEAASSADAAAIIRSWLYAWDLREIPVKGLA
jgi:hypothetical protein